MSPAESKYEPLSGPAVEAAITALGRLRALLLRAGQGGVDPQQVVRELKEFWVVHGPVIRTAGLALADELRRQALIALYKWRAQLAEQLQSRPTSGG